jgi:hypothetical protein
MTMIAARYATIAGSLAFLLLGPESAGAQSRSCATATTLGATHADAVKAVLTSTNPDYIAYAQAMGVTGVTSADIVTETNPIVCSAVTDAIVARIGGGPATSNYLILRAGPRFVAMDPAGKASVLYFVSSNYDDVRISLR